MAICWQGRYLADILLGRTLEKVSAGPVPAPLSRNAAKRNRQRACPPFPFIVPTFLSASWSAVLPLLPRFSSHAFPHLWSSIPLVPRDVSLLCPGTSEDDCGYLALCRRKMARVTGGRRFGYKNASNATEVLVEVRRLAEGSL